MPYKPLSSFQRITFPAVELCKLRKPDVVANPHTYFAERCRGTYREIKMMLVQLLGTKAAARRHHSRVSNIDKLFPGLSISDSWKRIFPGTSMSKRWILTGKTQRLGQRLWCWCYSLCAHILYLPVFKNEISIWPKHCTGVIQLLTVLFRDRSWWTERTWFKKKQKTSLIISSKSHGVIITMSF